MIELRQCIGQAGGKFQEPGRVRHLMPEFRIKAQGSGYKVQGTGGRAQGEAPNIPQTGNCIC